MGRIDFKLPDIGEGVAEGEITSWKVKAGDTVVEDQVMVEVMTDKATVEIGSPVDGTVAEIRAAEGETVPVGDVIVVLADSDDAGVTPAAPASAAPAHTAPAPAAAGGSGEEVNFALPDIGEGVAEGEITRWMVKAGDAVIEDQPMLEVMTDKATVEIGSPVDGHVLEILHDEGATVPVGEVLLVLGTGAPAAAPAHAASSAPATAARPGKAPKAAPAKAAVAPARAAAPAPARRPAAAPAAAVGATAVATRPSTVVLPETGLPPRGDGTRRVRAAPAVRRLAREMGVDIAALAGSGPNGRVTMNDVRGAKGAPAAPQTVPAPSPAPARAAPAAAAARAPARQPAAAPAPAAPAPAPHALEADERVPLRGLRKRIASQMRIAKQTAAHFAYVEEIDVTELVKLRRDAKEAAAAKGVKLTYMPFIIRATTIALREFPILNASLDEEAGELVYHHRINMGIAVDTPNGLIVPVIPDADRKTLNDVSIEMFEKAERARNGKTQPTDVGGGTFTITNAGNIGGLLATPIINVPEVAIMGVHAIRRRPWVVDDEIVIRDIMYLSLSLDHRVVDGAVGAYAMNRVKELLENPALMLLES